MWRNNYNGFSDGHCCPRRRDGSGRLCTVSLPSARRPSLITPQVLSTERQICCTDRLVRIYNNTADAGEWEILERWLWSHVAVFDKLNAYEKAEVAEEFARLVSAKGRYRSRNRMLVLRVLNVLGEALTDDVCTTEQIASALSHALASVDVTVFEGDPTDLLHLADSISKTLGRCIVQTKQSFEHHRPALVAFYQACAIVHRIAPGLPASLPLKKHQDGLLERLKIFRDTPCYLFRFFGMLIEQSIHRFTEGNEATTLFDAAEHNMTGTAGVLDFYRGVRLVDPSAISEGIQRFRTACADEKLRGKTWFDWLQVLSSAAMLCLTDPEKFEFFQSCLEQILEHQKHGIRDKEKRKAVRFGIVTELTAVATLAESAEVRKEAIFEFQQLATRHSLREGWDADPEVYEGLLDAASKIYQQGEFCELMAQVLEKLTQSEGVHLREIIYSWLGNEMLEHKLRSLLEEKEEVAPVCRGLLLWRVAEVEMPSSRNSFWPNRTVVDRPSFAAVNAVHQV